MSVGPEDLRNYLKLQKIYAIDTSAEGVVELPVCVDG